MSMQRESSRRGALETVILRDADTDSCLEMAPSRGGLLVRARIQGRELLYLDEESLLEPAKNVRGGIPICFPIAGKIPDNKTVFAGRDIELKQHGFARNMPWALSRADDGIEIELEASDATRRLFPFEFRIRVAYRIVGHSLACEATVFNPGPGVLPFHLGFHPYFFVPEPLKTRMGIEASATRAFDQRTGISDRYEPPRLGEGEVDYHLLDPAGGAVRLRAPRGEFHDLRLDYGGFPCVVIWTLAQRDFVCIEPWTAPAGALATGAGRIDLPPGTPQTRSWFVQIENIS
jgi:galactose mutarotase-like enzyme